MRRSFFTSPTAKLHLPKANFTARRTTSLMRSINFTCRRQTSLSEGQLHLCKAEVKKRTQWQEAPSVLFFNNYTVTSALDKIAKRNSEHLGKCGKLYVRNKAAAAFYSLNSVFVKINANKLKLLRKCSLRESGLPLKP